MEKSKKNFSETTEKIGITGKKATEEQDYTEALHGIISIRKGRIEEREVWFGTVGKQLVSDGTFETKKELIENLEYMTLERVCNIVAGAFERAINFKIEKI
jgi:hypothetical protein